MGSKPYTLPDMEASSFQPQEELGRKCGIWAELAPGRTKEICHSPLTPIQ